MSKWITILVFRDWLFSHFSDCWFYNHNNSQRIKNKGLWASAKTLACSYQMPYTLKCKHKNWQGTCWRKGKKRKEWCTISCCLEVESHSKILNQCRLTTDRVHLNYDSKYRRVWQCNFENWWNGFEQFCKLPRQKWKSFSSRLHRHFRV